MSGRWLSPPTEIFRKAREGRVRKVPFCKQEVHGRCKSLEDSSVTFKDLIHLDRLHLHVRQVKVLESVQGEKRIVGKALNWVPGKKATNYNPHQLLLILYLARERCLSLGIMCQTIWGGEGR